MSKNNAREYFKMVNSNTDGLISHCACCGEELIPGRFAYRQEICWKCFKGHIAGTLHGMSYGCSSLYFANCYKNDIVNAFDDNFGFMVCHMLNVMAEIYGEEKVIVR